jgi:hypothetical protein
MSSCRICGSDIYKVNDGSPDKYSWQHDITAGAGVPHQAYPIDTPDAAAESEAGIDVEAAGPRRFFAEHPSGYRAEYNGGSRYHIYDGDQPVDSPHLPGYSDAMGHDEIEGLASKYTRSRLQRHLNSWVKRNGDSYTQFNHPEDEPLSYADRQRFKELDRNASLTLEAFLYFFEAKPKKPVGEMSDSEYEVHKQTVAREKAEGEAWNAKHKINAKHIVDHWDKATPDEIHTGMSWYHDAHHMAKHIANDTGTPMHVMAGLVSNYSPQTHWATNIMTAAKVARTKTPMGGKGEGVLASENQKKAAGRMLDGEHYDKVLAGPKTRAFAHLIEHGGNADDNDSHVVIDRHALSVATGRRASDIAYSYSKLGNKGRYDEASHAYHLAAKRISKKVGHKVSAHQVQAATWLVRQRLNEEEDRAASKTSSSSSASLARKSIEHWNSYAGEHHPGLLGKIPGTGYSSAPEDVKHAVNLKSEGKGVTKEGSRMDRLAYGDIKAPNDVDTLRESECPVCGNDDSWDGDRCQVCGFFRPPQMFMDPDTSVAREVDLRKDVADQNGIEQPGMNADGDVVGGAGAQENQGGGMGLNDPMDPSALSEDGMIGGDPNDPTQPGGGDAMPNTDQADPNGIAAADAQSASNDMLIPGNLDESGQPIDPGAANTYFNQGGEPFAPGPNAPSPEQPIEPGGLDEEGNPIDPSQQGIPEPGMDGQEPAPATDGEPGTPDDGVSDLICPACGFQADGGQPTSQGDSAMDSQVASPGMIEGDACPRCGQAAMQSISSMMV